MRPPEHFARFVKEVISRLDRVACYEQGGPAPQVTWPELADDQWRDAVLTAMDKDIEVAFVEPTAEKPDWVFVARRKGWKH